MEPKKEVQERIIKNNDNKVSEEELSSILKLVAPGTNLRTALDGTLKAQKGALIAIENENLFPLIEGGFRINTKFTSQKLVELTKMDGAIVVSRDIKRINYANVLLTPDNKIQTSETGTRHKAAERTAKQAATLVIAISERKHEINIFYKNVKYPIIKTDELLRKANENLQLLEKQRELFDNHIEKLDSLEIRNYSSSDQAIQVIQKGLLIQKIAEDLIRYTIELGKESTLLKIRLKEITKGVEKEIDLVIKDYTLFPLRRSKTLLEDLSYEEILDNERILEILGYEKTNPQQAITKGWRILSKTSLIEPEIAMLIQEAGSIGKSIHSSVDFYKQILGEEKARQLKEELSKIKIDSIT